MMGARMRSSDARPRSVACTVATRNNTPSRTTNEIIDPAKVGRSVGLLSRVVLSPLSEYIPFSRCAIHGELSFAKVDRDSWPRARTVVRESSRASTDFGDAKTSSDTPLDGPPVRRRLAQKNKHALNSLHTLFLELHNHSNNAPNI